MYTFSITWQHTTLRHSFENLHDIKVFLSTNTSIHQYINQFISFSYFYRVDNQLEPNHLSSSNNQSRGVRISDSITVNKYLCY